jgi:hypothetical protein
MNFFVLFFDISAFTIGIAVVILFIALASAFFAFVMLRKTVKMAIRFVIVAVILLIALVGSVSFWWFSSGSTPQPRPNATRPR